VAGRGHAVSAARFPGFQFRESGDFKLLGAAFGSPEFCTAHLIKRCLKAKHLLGQISAMGDSQTAMLLARNCVGFCKVAYSMRTVPPLAHAKALEEYSELIRESLGNIAGADVDDRGWAQASLPMRAGGLGLRSESDHAYAAYVASFRGAAGLAQEIDPNFDPEDAHNFCGLQDATQGLAARVRPEAAVSLGMAGAKQKRLSGLIDASKVVGIKAAQSGDRPYLQHLALQTVHGAGAWLTALPTEEDLRLDPPSFRVTLARRLRLAIQPVDTPCPRCGGLMDRYGDHALTCACSGDRTRRHNALRNQVHEFAREAGLGPEKEKGGLLPASMDHGGEGGRGPAADPPPGGGWEPPDPGPDRVGRGRRRPADVYVPRGPLGTARALDFAVTSGMRPDREAAVLADPEGAIKAYEDSKRSFRPPGAELPTEEACLRAGFCFIPMVMEAHGGGWGAEARAAIASIARCVAAARCIEPAAASLAIAQRISVALHRENARAVLKRRMWAGDAADGEEPDEASPDADLA
jgi:hypothetical protein